MILIHNDGVNITLCLQLPLLHLFFYVLFFYYAVCYFLWWPCTTSTVSPRQHMLSQQHLPQLRNPPPRKPPGNPKTRTSMTVWHYSYRNISPSRHLNSNFIFGWNYFEVKGSRCLKCLHWSCLKQGSIIDCPLFNVWYMMYIINKKKSKHIE